VLTGTISLARQFSTTSVTRGTSPQLSPEGSGVAERLRIAYLVSTPAITHTFISREVAGLRRLGFDVQTFSVRRAPKDQLLTAEQRRAAEDTPSIQPPDPRSVLESHARAVNLAPWRYVQTLALALRLSPGGTRAMLWHFFYFVEAIVLWDWLHQRGIKHVHAHFADAATMISLLYAHFGQDGGATWSFTMHGPAEFDHVRAYRLTEKVARARFVVCISDFARSQLMKLTSCDQWRKLRVVRCGVDLTLFRPFVKRGELERDRLTVLCVGRLAPDKGHVLLIEALLSLPPSVAGRLRVVIAGDGPERAALQQRAAGLREGQAAFLGAVGQDRLLSLYANADIFCLPSLAEGLPVVLMEAMAMELPVITTRIMGIPELVTDGVSGLLVPPGKADSLAAALVELLEDDDLRRSLGKAARERVVRDYDIRSSVAQLYDLYRAEIPTQSHAA
jgi:colanic acid/amylovoran biosynthesis glycosyltransferase